MRKKLSQMVLTRHIIIHSIVVIVSVVLASCSSKPIINSFDVDPSTVCPGTFVRLRWDTTSDYTTLSKEPGGDIAGPFVGGAGEERLNFPPDSSYGEFVSTNTTYQLRAVSYVSAVTDFESVAVLEGTQDHNLGVPGKCVDGEPTWTVSANSFGPRNNIQGVRNQSGVNAFVSHAGIPDIPIDTGHPSDSFNGTGASGEWKVRVAPEDIRPSWEEFCRDNPDWDLDVPGDVVIPVPPISNLPSGSEPPQKLWLRVTVGC